jgi:BirA family transcriptional regulator, biotin operon repressor / biotin---[acetyl-CoA-carboxylase] ligase
VSILIRTPLPLREAAHLTSITALSLVKILNLAYGLQAQVKWPNDVLASGKKLAGILTEMQSDQDFTRFVVIGIGINCNHSSEDFEGASFRYPATSVAIETGSRIKRQNLLIAFLEQFEREYARFVKGGYPALLADLEGVSAILRRTVTVHRGDEDIQGEALGFTPEGALVLRKPDGQREIIWVGDVTRVEGAF